jgi:pyruvate dehydrogenase E1 component beta subunit
MAEYTFREVIAQAMSEEMRKDESIYLMGRKLQNITVHIKLQKECWMNLVLKE